MKLFNISQEWRDKWYPMVFRSDTAQGKVFDILLLIVIGLSVFTALLDSVPGIHIQYGTLLRWMEWGFTIIFTIEYFFRLLILHDRKWHYILSVLGIIDLLAILPTYLGFFFPAFHYLIILRSLRLLRIFRIFKLWRYLKESGFILKILYAGYRKIMIFMLFILLMAVVMGAFMYVIEADTPGFESIPSSIYWAVVTITTVGYGDITPATALGRFVSTFIMLIGYSIIAVYSIIAAPIENVAAGGPTRREKDILKRKNEKKEVRACPRCRTEIDRSDANFCWKCGESLSLDE